MVKMGSVTLKWVDPHSLKVEYVNLGVGDQQTVINGKKAVNAWVLQEIESHGIVK